MKILEGSHSDTTLTLLLWQDGATVSHILKQKQKAIYIILKIEDLTIEQFSQRPSSTIFDGIGSFDVIRINVEPGLIPMRTIKNKLQQTARIRLDDINSYFLIANKTIDIREETAEFDIDNIVTFVQFLGKFMLQFLFLRSLHLTRGEFDKECMPSTSSTRILN